MPSLRALLSFLLAALLFAVPAAATWSIVIVDLATGEIAVGIATCLTGFDLRPNTVVVVPGRGVAAAQSFVGPISLRELIRDGLLNGDSAAQILAALAAADSGHQLRQYGIVSLTGGEVTFTGTGAGAWAGGVTGQSGTLRYAIQGNVLTGSPVVQQAEQAILNTPGGLPDKMMAAMEAARQMGGDGRCSCPTSTPPGCGSPPPSFTKAAHIALMIVSRPSDVDAPCNGSLGCGAGDYWLDINIANQTASDPDPVLQLQTLFNTWKQNQVGRPDHFESVATVSAPTIRANGIDTSTVTVELRDAAGVPIGNSLPLTVQLADNSTTGNVSFGPITALPNGSYEFDVQGHLDAGVAVLDIAATDAFGRVGLWPRPSVTFSDVFGDCGSGAVPDGFGGVADVLRVDGSAGVDRVVEVGYGQPFTLSLDAPPQGGQLPVGLFALWVLPDVPASGTGLPIGPGNELCFAPMPFGASPTALIADSFGLGGQVMAGPAPWTLPIPGLDLVLDASLQGVVVSDPGWTLSATNAVHLRLRPLNAPVITDVVPSSPLPGQTVTVTGTDFYLGVVGKVGNTVVPVTYVSPTQVTFPMPNAFSCDAALAIGNLGGSSASTVVNPTPVITAVPVASGPAAGGANVYVIGSHLDGCSVTINGAAATIITQGAGTIIATTPPGTPGPAVIRVENANGCFDTANYTYL